MNKSGIEIFVHFSGLKCSSVYSICLRHTCAKAIPSDAISENDMVNDLEEQSYHPQPDTKSEDEDTITI